MFSPTPVPHEEAASMIRGKPAVTRAVFDSMLPELRGRAFTVTGIEDANILQTIRDHIAALPEGDTWEQAKGNIVDALHPWLGEESHRRAELLLRTHAFQAFQASNYRVIQADEDTTHMQYLATEDDRVRDSHLALNGIILPKTDPFWQKHYPPWEWGCRCRCRGINPDLLDEAKTDDEERAPENKLVMEGPALRKLNEGTLIRDGRAYDVTPPSDSNRQNGFSWHPDDLHIPLDQLKSRYDETTWTQFEQSAKATTLDGEQTLWDWLNEKPKTAPVAQTAHSPATPPKAEPPVNLDGIQQFAQKAKAAGFSPEIQKAIHALPPPISKWLGNLDIATGRKAFYQPSQKQITMAKDPKSWNGHPTVVRHEIGHHLHRETGTVTDFHVAPEFKAAMEKDLAGWKKWAQDNGGIEFYKKSNAYAMVDKVAKLIGLDGYDPADAGNGHRVGRITDTIMGLTNGKYGLGHSVAYMKQGGAAKEVFTHAFTAQIENDTHFKNMFPNVVNHVKVTLKI